MTPNEKTKQEGFDISKLANFFSENPKDHASIQKRAAEKARANVFGTEDPESSIGGGIARSIIKHQLSKKEPEQEPNFPKGQGELFGPEFFGSEKLTTDQVLLKMKERYYELLMKIGNRGRPNDFESKEREQLEKKLPPDLIAQVKNVVQADKQKQADIHNQQKQISQPGLFDQPPKPPENKNQPTLNLQESAIFNRWKKIAGIL